MINYAKVLDYLDAIGNATGGAIDSPGCPHLRWWKDGTGANLSYAQFTSGTVNGITPAVPIIDPTAGTDKSNSVFFKILLGPATFGAASWVQMPKGGPFITDSANDSGTGTDVAPGSAVFTLPSDGSNVTGKQIQDDLRTWLQAGAPER